VISTGSVSLSFALDDPVSLPITLSDVKLSTLLGEVSKGRIDGTGRIAGTLPVTWYPDGRITISEGSAGAQDDGIISVSPELLSGDNAQLAIARQALENFHYTALKITVSSDEAEHTTLSLRIEGSNPEAFGGKPVNLNV